MATVDFGTWNPSSDRRAEVERVAKRLPTDWLVAFEPREGAGAASYPVVVKDGAGRRVAQGSFNSGALEGVPGFLERLSRRRRYHVGDGPPSAS
jgi:hypothetical protein